MKLLFLVTLFLAPLAGATKAVSVYNTDGRAILYVQSDSSESASAAEVLHSMQSHETEVEHLADVFFYERLRAQSISLTQTQYRIELDQQTPAQLDALQAEAKQGRLHVTGYAARDLAYVIYGYDDSDATTDRVTGKYIRCQTPKQGPVDSASCDISLAQGAPLEHLEPVAGCDAFVERVAQIYDAPMWGDGEKIALVLKVSKAIAGEVASIHFKQSYEEYRTARFQPLAKGNDEYRFDFETVFNPHGGTAIPVDSNGSFVIKLKDGRTLQLLDGAQKPFQIDSPLAKSLSTMFKGSLPDDEISRIPLAADIAGQDSGARYFNSKQCR